MTISSTRGARPDDLRHPFGTTLVAGFFRAYASKATRGSRWVAIIYVVVALATPLLMVAGPEVMPPAAPVIADKALDGALAAQLHWPRP